MKKTVLVLYYHFYLYYKKKKVFKSHQKFFSKNHIWLGVTIADTWFSQIRKHWKLSDGAIKHVLLWKHSQQVGLFTELVAGRNSGSWLVHQVGVYLHHILLDNVRCQCLLSWHCVWLIFTDGRMDFCRARPWFWWRAATAVCSPDSAPYLRMYAVYNDERWGRKCQRLMCQRSHVWARRPFPAVINLSVATRYPWQEGATAVYL